MTRTLLLGASAALALSLGATAALAASESTTSEATAINETAANDPGRIESACLDRLDEAERSMNDAGQVVGGRELRTLRDAAMIFARADLEEACEEVVEGIEEYGEARAEAARTGSMSDEERAAYAERVQQAAPLSEARGGHRAGNLIGDEIVSLSGERIGDVDDVMIAAEGEARYVLVGTGGLFGIGEDYVPVEISRLRVIDEDTLALPVEAEVFEGAPRVEADDIEQQLESWGHDVETWWTEQVAQSASAQ